MTERINDIEFNDTGAGDGRTHDQPVLKRSRLRPSRILGGIVIVGSFALWIYAFSGAARRDPPNRLDSPEFATAAESICAPVIAAIDQLPRAETARTAAERAGVIEQATSLLDPMVDTLSGEISGSDRDRGILTEWLDDWDLYLRARRDYATNLRLDPTSRFLLPIKGPRAVSASIENLAIVNDMPSCGNPGDVG